MISLRKCKYFIFISILFCILILLALYIKNIIRERDHEKVEKFESEVKECHNTSTVSTREDNELLVKMTKITDTQNADAKYDSTINTRHLPETPKA